MFLVSGESLIDLVAQGDGNYHPAPGGAPYNFARALALQGVPSRYLNPFSGDVFGQLLRQVLSNSGAQHDSPPSNKPTSLALVSTDAAGHPRYSFYRDGVADRSLTVEQITQRDTQDIIGYHTGALALVPPDHLSAIATLRHFRARGVACTVDVNMRPAVARAQGIALADYRAAALVVMRSAHVVKLSDEDLDGLGITQAPEEFATSLLSAGCRLVVLTLGASGAQLFSKAHRITQTAFTAQVIDTVGAGDAFFAGFISALCHQDVWSGLLTTLPDEVVLTQALRHAAACAAINVGRRGCQPPTWDEAIQWAEGKQA